MRTHKTTIRSHPRLDSGLTAILALLLAISLDGCATSDQQPTKAGATTEAPNPIQLSLRSLTHTLHYAPGNAIPGPAETAALNDFLANSGIAPGDPITIERSAPGGHPPSVLAEARIQRLTAALARQDVKPMFASAPDLPAGDIRLTFEHYVASAPNCPNWSKAPGNDFGNTLHSDYGCATATNLAAMIADPRDLAEGRTMGPARGNPAIAAMHRYATGKVPSLSGGETTSTSPEMDIAPSPLAAAAGAAK
jgi:pilus assembly protein CpaD